MSDEADQADVLLCRSKVASDLPTDELSLRRRLKSDISLDRVEVPLRRGGRAAPLPTSADIAIPTDAWIEVTARPNVDVELLDLVVDNAAGWLLEDARVNNKQAGLQFPCGLDQLSRWLRRQIEGHAWSRVDADTEVLLRVRRVDDRAWSRFSAVWVARTLAVFERPMLTKMHLGRMPLWHPDPVPIRFQVSWEQSVQVTTRVTDILPALPAPVLVEAIVLRRAADWIVNDVRIDDKSCFAQAGDVPGVVLEALAAYDLDLGVATRDVVLVVGGRGADLEEQVLHGDVLVTAVRY